MSRQLFLGIFLLVIGLIGLIVGLVTGHIADSPVIYLLPVLLGVVMILVDRVGK